MGAPGAGVRASSASPPHRGSLRSDRVPRDACCCCLLLLPLLRRSAVSLATQHHLQATTSESSTTSVRSRFPSAPSPIPRRAKLGAMTIARVWRWCAGELRRGAAAARPGAGAGAGGRGGAGAAASLSLLPVCILP